jgi:hypothetical protein
MGIAPASNCAAARERQEVVTDNFGGMTPQKWTPPPCSNGMQQTPINSNLDCYRLGETVAWHVARANQHVAARHRWA